MSLKSSLIGDLAKAHDSHLRLAVLQLLEQQPGYCANNQVLLMALGAMGLACTADQLRGHISWLEEQRLVTAMALGSGMLAVTVTERGADVAAGRSVISGVARPGPKGD